MAVELPDARGLSDEVLEALRLRAVAAREAGHAVTTIAEVLGLARETVQRWCASFKKAGIAGLPGERSGRPVGSGRRLTEEEEKKIQELISLRGKIQIDYDWEKEEELEMEAQERREKLGEGEG